MNFYRCAYFLTTRKSNVSLLLKVTPGRVADKKLIRHYKHFSKHLPVIYLFYGLYSHYRKHLYKQTMFELGFYDSFAKWSKLFQMTGLLTGVKDHSIIMWLQYKVFINDKQILIFLSIFRGHPLMTFIKNDRFFNIHPNTRSTTFQTQITTLLIVDRGHLVLSLNPLPRRFFDIFPNLFSFLLSFQIFVSN